MSRRFKNEHEQGWVISDAEHDELLRLRQQLPELQEIAVRVKLGQLEVWPDASMTSIGTSLREANAEIRTLTEQLERVKTWEVWRLCPVCKGRAGWIPGCSLCNGSGVANSICVPIAGRLPTAVGSRVKFPDGTIVDCDETAELRSKLERAEAETSRLREELEKAFERPSDPACASDAERDAPGVSEANHEER